MRTVKELLNQGKYPHFLYVRNLKKSVNVPLFKWILSDKESTKEEKILAASRLGTAVFKKVASELQLKIVKVSCPSWKDMEFEIGWFYHPISSSKLSSSKVYIKNWLAVDVRNL